MSETKTPAKPTTTPASKVTTELKVSGHLMTFDAGLYVIFHPPGSALPDPATGLPGVRLSLPPGPAFRPEAINISTFRDDGWLGGSGAALVRVARGPAQIMVTIYQAPQSKGEAPKLQIMRLAEGHAAQGAAPQAAAAAVAAPAPAVAAPQGAIQGAIPGAPQSPPQNTPPGGAVKSADAGPAEIVAHIQTRGDVTSRLKETMGEPGSKHWIEGFSISPKAVITPADIEYQAVLGRGWLSPWSEGGQFCGSRGMSLPILGLRVRLRGEAAERLDCAVTATFVDGTKVGPRDTGEPAQADSLAPLESFRVDITPRAAGGKATPKAAEKPAAAPAKGAKPAAPAAKAPPPKAPAKPAAKGAPPKRK